jgi:MFS family permease
VGLGARRVYGWGPLVALAGTLAIEAGERQSLAQAVDGIQKQFHISDLQVSVLPTAMIIVAAVGAIPIGMLTDRVRRTALLGGAVAVWTVTMGLNGLATTYAMLFAFRLGVGAVEANGPASVSLISDYYPARTRARMLGLFQSGALVGSLIGLVLGGVAVSIGGWRWAFFMWVPAGVAVMLLVLRQPNPERGTQELDWETEPAEVAVVTAGADLAEAVGATGAALPPPVRVGTRADYRNLGAREVMRELLQIRSMWFGVLALTLSQLLLTGLQFWAVEYFKRVHGLTAPAAGAVTGLMGLGSAVGIVSGGFLADRLLRRGILNARVYVVAAGSVAASVLLMPAFASTTLPLTMPLLVLGATALTLPIAPAEAMVSDVVVADLRGRAATVRSIVRALAAAGPLVIGGLSNAFGLRLAIVSIVPLYAVGGIAMLAAARSYPADVAFVVAESRRLSKAR